MRVLFTCHPALGHFLPLTPIARAMRDAGHDVRFGTPRFFGPTVEAAGFAWTQAGAENDDPELAPVWARYRGLRGPERMRCVNEEIFGGIRARRMVPDLLALATTWRPDLFVRDTREFGAMVAGELLDVPDAQVQINAVGGFRRATVLSYPPLQRLRASFGLPERPIDELVDRYLVLSPFPEALNEAGEPIAPTTHRYRALPAEPARTELPGWLDGIGSRPVIYVSLGTEFSGVRGHDVFSRLLAGLGDIDAEVIVTVGPEFDPTALGPQPAHIHLASYLPLAALLPRCAMIVFHGGSGTLSYAIAHALPMVMIPLGADQPVIAARCADLGASRTLQHDQLTPEHVRDVTLDVLTTPSYRRVAERLRDEFNALPGLEYVVGLLERLAREKSPIVADG